MIAAAAAAGVAIHDLYERYPDYDIDARAEQDALRAAELVVCQYPTYWYRPPALFQLWIEMVLTSGWAYGPGGAALVGKHFWCVTTTGGAQSAYAADGIHGFDYETFLAPLVQTVRLCGMHWLPPWIIHGAPQLSSAELQDWVARYRDRLTRYPAWLTAA